ncbi:MAG: hypothetical protein V4864_12385 [Pseudomonadota bacterium]
MTFRRILSRLAAAAAIAAVAPCALAATKDVVMDRITAPASAPATAQAGDAMVVSVLVESPNGTLAPRPVSARFHTGDRFRIKVLASRDGSIALYNTRPNGERVAAPLWRGNVTRGLELLTPRLRLDGMRGTDQLHVVLEPPQEPNVLSWLVARLSSKDVQLDVQNTATETYLMGGARPGLWTTLFITHR